MNRTLIIIAALAPYAAFAANSAAKAQEAPKAFTGQCKDYAASKEACDATQWCHFVTRKAIKLPDGTDFTPAAYCGFKAGLKQAWTQKQAKN